MKYAQLTTRQIAAHKELCAAIDENEDISERLKAEESKDIKDLLAGYDDYNISLPISYDFSKGEIDLLFYAITSGKTKSAESILTYIDSKSFKKQIYSTLAINLFDACCAKDKKNAKTIIAFAKENNILEDLLKKHLNNNIAEEFFKKDENHQYAHNNASMISALEKHARNRDYTPKIGEHANSFVKVLGIICAIAICATPLIMLDPAFIVLPLIGVVCMLSLIVVMIASEQYNNWSHKRDCNKNIIQGLQEQLNPEKNSQQQSAAPIKEQEGGEGGKEGKPSPDSTVLEMVSPEAAATGAIVGNALLNK